MVKEIRCINKKGREVFIPESLSSNASYMNRNELQIQDLDLMKQEVEEKLKTFNDEIVVPPIESDPVEVEKEDPKPVVPGPVVVKKEEAKVEKNTKK